MARKDWHTAELDTMRLPNRPKAERVWLMDEAHGLRVGIVPADGGEIASFQVRLRGRWQEILYRALDYRSAPPDGWDGRAPLLWPVAGRVFTPEQIAQWKRTGRKPTRSAYRLGGRLYDLPGHGFARLRPWRLDRVAYGVAGAACSCSLESTEETVAMYPFDFHFTVTYTLAEGALRLRYALTAGEKNRRPMPFNIGNHISFKMPFTRRGKFEDCSLRTPARKILEQNKLCLLSGKERPVDLTRPTPLARAEFLDIVLAGYRRDELWLELTDPYAMRLRIRHGEVPQGGRYHSAEKDNFFVFWGTAQHGYFCPEPWIGRPNAPQTRRDCVLLPPGERFVWEIAFAVDAIAGSR